MAAVPRRWAVAIAVFVAILVAGAAAEARAEAQPQARPEARPEVRGVWLTTNLGLDWPAGVAGPEAQRAALTAMLDRLAAANFNLVIFQVQANGDALWPSTLLPAMADVTGDGSRRLSYDVCRMAIDECHARGMECHAWVVPFRLGTAKQAARYQGNPVGHPTATRRSHCVAYRGAFWLDPGDPANRQWLVEAYRELVRAYDFDGLSLDYTRYPGADFPDGATYRRHARRGQTLADWRRDNINSFVAALYDMVAAERPDMMVGAAPIGTYKNVGAMRNSTAYDNFCQDAAQWARSGHCDFLVPQMYWGEQSGFTTAMATWAAEAGASATLAAGLAAYKMADAGWSAADLASQVEKARRADAVDGVVFFRAAHVAGDAPKAQALYRLLADSLFAAPAPLPWAAR